MKSTISIIAAIGKNRELGKDNKLLWDVPEDMKRFRTLTSGHPIIMGRKTFASIGRVLPNRTNIVITRDAAFVHDGVVVVNSLDQAIEVGKQSPGGDETFVIGGGQIFEQALPVVDKLYLTIIDKTFDADVFFPAFEEMFPVVLNEQKGTSNGFDYAFIDLVG